MKRHTSATPAGVPRSRSKWTRRFRKQVRAEIHEVWKNYTTWQSAWNRQEPRFHGIPILWYPYPEPSGADTIAQG
jgi:hypothetical protein